MVEIDKFELRRRRTRRCAFLLEVKLRDILGEMEGHTHKKVATGGGVQRNVGERLLWFVLHLAPDNDGGRITESVGVGREEPFNRKHHAAYVRLALQVQDGREMAADAGLDGKRSTSKSYVY